MKNNSKRDNFVCILSYKKVKVEDVNRTHEIKKILNNNHNKHLSVMSLNNSNNMFLLLDTNHSWIFTNERNQQMIMSTGYMSSEIFKGKRRKRHISESSFLTKTDFKISTITPLETMTPMRKNITIYMMTILEKTTEILHQQTLYSRVFAIH